MPSDHIYIGRNKYWYHSSSTHWPTILKRIQYYKKTHKCKFHVMATDSWYTSTKVYHLYLTKIRSLV
jgi:hypothetical protein